MNVFICVYCGDERKNHNSWRNHERLCPLNPDRVYQNGMKGNPGNNQFTKAKKLGLPVPKISDETKQKIGNSSLGRKHSEEFKEKQRQNAIKRGLGGVRQSKWITYKGKTLGSSYELTVAKSLDENKVQWDVCHRFNYIDPTGKKRTYTPDFYLPEFDVYLDPKNDFLINNINPKLGFSDKEKISLVEQQNGIRIIILDKNELDWYTISLKIS